MSESERKPTRPELLVQARRAHRMSVSSPERVTLYGQLADALEESIYRDVRRTELAETDRILARKRYFGYVPANTTTPEIEAFDAGFAAGRFIG